MSNVIKLDSNRPADWAAPLPEIAIHGGRVGHQEIVAFGRGHRRFTTLASFDRRDEAVAAALQMVAEGRCEFRDDFEPVAGV